MNRTNKSESHYHWHDTDEILKIIFVFAALFIIFVNIINLIVLKISEDKLIYDKCVDSCVKNNFFSDNAINADARVICISNCNELYLKLINRK